MQTLCLAVKPGFPAPPCMDCCIKAHFLHGPSLVPAPLVSGDQWCYLSCLFPYLLPPTRGVRRQPTDSIATLLNAELFTVTDSKLPDEWPQFIVLTEQLSPLPTLQFLQVSESSCQTHLFTALST